MQKLLEKIKEEDRELVIAATFCGVNQTFMAEYIGTSQASMSKIKNHVLKNAEIIGPNEEVNEEAWKGIRTEILNKIGKALYEEKEYKDQTDLIESLKKEIEKLKAEAETPKEKEELTADENCLENTTAEEIEEVLELTELKKALDTEKIRVETFKEAIRLFVGG